MASTRRKVSKHEVPWSVVARTLVEYENQRYQMKREKLRLYVGDRQRREIGPYADTGEKALVVKLTPGCQTYYEARAYLGSPFTCCDLVAAVIVAAIGGHPDAEEARAGTQLSAIWSHHLAIVGREDPRRVTTTYAPSETKSISGLIQNMAVRGIRVSGCEERSS